MCRAAGAYAHTPVQRQVARGGIAGVHVQEKQVSVPMSPKHVMAERVLVEVGMAEESSSFSICANGKSKERDGWVNQGSVRKTIRFWQKRSLTCSFYGSTSISNLFHPDRWVQREG